MLIFGIKHFLKPKTKKAICSGKIWIILLLANWVEIDSFFFLFTHCIKNLPIPLKKPPFIQNRLFILISFYHSSDVCLCPQMFVISYILALYMCDKCVLSFNNIGNFNTRTLRFCVQMTENSVQNMRSFSWLSMDMSVLLVFNWRISSCKQKVYFLHLIPHNCLGSLWNPLGAHRIFNP